MRFSTPSIRQEVQNSTTKGILYMTFASFLFATTILFAKLLSPSMSSVEITFFRNLVGLVVVAHSFGLKPASSIGGRPAILVFRGIVGTFALLAFFYTVSATTLSNAIIYAKTEPIFTAILAFFLLKERVNARLIIAIITGFVGVYLMSEHSMSELSILGLLTGFLSALAYTSIRSLKSHYDERIVVLSFMLSGVVIPLVLMFIAEFYSSDTLSFMLSNFTMPSGADWLYIIALGVFAAFGQFYMTKAYFFANASIVSTASYSVVLFASIFGVLLGDALPTGAILLGMALIIASGILIAIKR